MTPTALIHGGHATHGTARENLRALLETHHLVGHGDLATLSTDPPGTWAMPYEGHTNWATGDARWAVAHVALSPDEFLAVQFEIARERSGATTQAAWEAETVGDVAGLTDTLSTGPGSVPRPVLLLEPDGTRRTYQEGRSRALAARSLGHESMDVAVAAMNYR